MRIAIFSDTFSPEINGVATSTSNLHTILNRMGHFCITVTTNPYSKETIFENNVIRVPGIELKRLYNYRMASFFNSKAAKILNSFKIDVVHIQTEAGVGIFGKIYAKMKRIPYVYTYHTMYEDYTYYATKGKVEPLAKKIVRNYSKWQAEAASELISPSDKTKEALREYGVDRYINVVPTGIDFSRFEKKNIDFDELKRVKKKLGIDKTFNLIYVGRIAKEKGIDVLLRGYQKFLEKEASSNVLTKFVIVGGGPALLELEELSRHLKISDQVVFVGKVPPDKVGFYYHLGDVFASASVTETQGLTFMEAMAASKLLMARYDENLVGVIKDKETGLFFKDENDFVKKFVTVLQMDEKVREGMVAKAYQLSQKYSLETFGRNVIRVYERAVRNYW